MTVRAKFTVDIVTQTVNGYAIKLNPVVGDGSPENNNFYKWTPSGSIDLQIVSTLTAAAFKVGKPYYVDFTPVE